MKGKLLKINSLILGIFTIFFIYENLIALKLMQSENINLIYTQHHEIFYTRIIYYELEISTFTHFTIGSFFKIIFNFIQAIGIVEILYILFSIPIYLTNEKDNRLEKIYISYYNVFSFKMLLTIVCFLLAYLTYTIDISIAWLLIRIVFILSIIYYTYILCKLIKYEFF